MNHRSPRTQGRPGLVVLHDPREAETEPSRRNRPSFATRIHALPSYLHCQFRGSVSRDVPHPRVTVPNLDDDERLLKVGNFISARFVTAHTLKSKGGHK